MNITFPINELLKKGLTAEDYTIASLIKEGKFGLLKTYIELLGNTFYTSLKRLKKLGYIEYNTVGDIIPVRESKITDKFIELTLKGDSFEEFYDAYPVSTHRPDGKYDYLRRNKIKSKTKYKKVVKNNLMIHDHIMDCLRWEINNREKFGSMAYMKQMSNWLDNEEWKIVEDLRRKIENNKTMSQQINNYGTELL